MKVPVSPPNWFELIKNDSQKMLKALAIPDQPDNYLHWDALRRRPPPDGADHEIWWVSTKLRRTGARQATPFKDITGNPFWFTEPAILRHLTRMVDLHWGGAMSTQHGIPTQGEARTYLVRSLAEEPFSSSFLEGAATTREIAKELIFRDRTPRTRDERMVLNNYRGLTYVKQHINEPLTPDIILGIHKAITSGTLDRPEMAGVIRAKKDEIYVSDETTGEILHNPPESKTLVARMQLLCDFANQAIAESNFIHPVLRSMIIHFMLSYDHPFIDGNGRTARALFYWSMLRQGYWLAEYTSISSVIKDAPIKYGRSFLETETDEGDLTYFLLHQADAVSKSELRLREYIEKKRNEVESLSSQIEKNRRDGGYNHRQTALLNDLVRRRISNTTINSYQSSHTVSYHTARNDLEELTRRGLLIKKRGGRESFYNPSPTLEKRLLGQ